MKYDKEKFKTWLRRHTTLLEGSIEIYASVIQTFHNEYTTLTIKNIAEFISMKNRESNSVHVRAPFLHYFKFKDPDGDHEKLIKKIPKVRRLPKKRENPQLSSEQIKKLIVNIKNDMHRAVAALQFYTGARVFEILTLREDKIDSTIIKDTKVIRLVLTVKGKKERTVCLDYSIAKRILSSWLKDRSGFVFLKDEINSIYELNENLFWRKVESQKRSYNRSISTAAKKMNIKRFASHDFRRHFINQGLELYGDIFLVKNMVGHARVDTTAGYSKDRSPEATEATLKMQRSGL